MFNPLILPTFPLFSKYFPQFYQMRAQPVDKFQLFAALYVEYYPHVEKFEHFAYSWV